MNWYWLTINIFSKLSTDYAIIFSAFTNFISLFTGLYEISKWKVIWRYLFIDLALNLIGLLIGQFNFPAEEKDFMPKFSKEHTLNYSYH